MTTLQQHFPEIQLEELIGWACVNGAKACIFQIPSEVSTPEKTGGEPADRCSTQKSATNGTHQGEATALKSTT